MQGARGRDARVPYVYVTKDFFLSDIQFRGAISDFHPMKALIEKYPEEELMLAWDEEEWYGQNFFLVHDLKCRDAVLADEEARARGELGGPSGGGSGGAVDDFVLPEYKEWVPGLNEWVSQGSEAEIAEEAAGDA